MVGTKLRLPEASFAKPTFTHMAICALVSHGYVSYFLLVSGFPLNQLL